jgi:RND family efflux transporter MFP subunit
VAAAEAVAALVAPSLALRLALRQWFAGRVADALRDFARACRDPRRPSFRFGVAAAVLVALFLGFADGEHRVSGKAVIEGEVQRALAAPFEGFIAEAPVRAGQRVSAGEILAALDDRDLKLDRSKWAAEREQADRKYRDALAKHDRANARILAAQLAEANAQVALAEDKLARSQLRAPFDGIVVSGDLSQLLGTPVEKGKVLYEVAPLDAYRVVLKVPEATIRHVRAGQSGRIVLAGISGEQLAFHVKNVGVAAAEDGENVFRVEAELDGSTSGLRPGMEGVGKVQIGERRLVWIWTHTFWEWVAVTLWRWLP